MKRLLYLLMAALLALVVSCKKDPAGKASSVKTLETTDITSTGACLHARISFADNSWARVDFGFYWGTSEDALDTYIMADDFLDDENAYSAVLSGLDPDTQYWYKAYMEIDGTPFSGETMSFKTGGNTIVIDGVSKSIVEAVIDKKDMNSNHYDISLYFVKEPPQMLHLQFDGGIHLGKTIDLTAGGYTPQGQSWYWYIAVGNDIKANESSKLCEGGTLYTSRLEDEDGCPVMELVIKDCIIDGHTLSLYFKGRLTPEN